MVIRLLIGLLIVALLIAGPTLAHDDEKPTIGILRYGGTSLMALAEKGILDMLQAYELINAEERAILDESEDLEGENINVIYRDAGFDLGTANIDVQISEELLAMADWLVENGESTEGVTPELPEVGIELPEMPLEERRAADLEFLAGLYCTDEMIEEQKAQLETQWSD